MLSDVDCYLKEVNIQIHIFHLLGNQKIDHRGSSDDCFYVLLVAGGNSG